MKLNFWNEFVSPDICLRYDHISFISQMSLESIAYTYGWTDISSKHTIHSIQAVSFIWYDIRFETKTPTNYHVISMKSEGFDNDDVHLHIQNRHRLHGGDSYTFLLGIFSTRIYSEPPCLLHTINDLFEFIYVDSVSALLRPLLPFDVLWFCIGRSFMVYQQNCT